MRQGRMNCPNTYWIVNGRQQKVYTIGGMPDHIHLLVSIKPDISISTLVKDIKSNSSKWINQKTLVLGKIQWQEGFAVFSYAHSQLDNVIRYISNQEQHHNKRSFKEGYIEMLTKFKIDHNEKYLVEWIE